MYFSLRKHVFFKYFNLLLKQVNTSNILPHKSWGGLQLWQQPIPYFRYRCDNNI